MICPATIFQRSPAANVAAMTPAALMTSMPGDEPPNTNERIYMQTCTVLLVKVAMDTVLELKGDESYTTTLELEHHYTTSNGDGDEDMCVLCHQPLLSCTSRTCILDFLPEGSDYYNSRPECKTTGKLACGHRFCALGILYHMYALGMQCPICRRGSKGYFLNIGCVPEHLQTAFQVCLAPCSLCISQRLHMVTILQCVRGRSKRTGGWHQKMRGVTLKV